MKNKEYCKGDSRIALTLAETMKKAFFPIIAFCAFLFHASPCLAQPDLDTAKEHAQKGDVLMVEGKLFDAVAEYRQALASGLKDPEIYRNLSLALYNLRLVDEALDVMGTAVALAGDRDLFHLEAGILLAVKDQLEKAETELFKALAINPGLTDAYYYLARVYYREKKYRLAWYGAKAALALGHPDRDLSRQLAAVAKEPAFMPWSRPGEKILFRQIVADTREEADKIAGRIKAGEFFEDIAAEEYKGMSEHNGGVVGQYLPEEIDSDVAKVLTGNEVFSGPFVVDWKDAYLVVQRLAPVNKEKWQSFGQDSSVAGKTIEDRPVIMPSAPPITNIPEGDRTIPVTDRFDRRKIRVYTGCYPVAPLAVDMAMKIRAQGYPAYVFVDRNRKGQIMYNAMAGEYSSRNEAERIRAELKGRGFSSFLSAP